MADGHVATASKRLRGSESDFHALLAGWHSEIADARRAEGRVHERNRPRPQLGLMPEHGLQGELRQMDDSEHGSWSVKQ